jgi:hypothetical protein
VKLKVNLIANRKYYRAGEEIPDDELPPFARKYAIIADADGEGESLRRTSRSLRHPPMRLWRTRRMLLLLLTPHRASGLARFAA